MSFHCSAEVYFPSPMDESPLHGVSCDVQELSSHDFQVNLVANSLLDFSIFKASYAPIFRKEDIFNFAMTDPAALHALLVHSALNLRGVRQLKHDPDMLYHQGETIRLINDRLGDSGYKVASDATIFTVANMTHLEV